MNTPAQPQDPQTESRPVEQSARQVERPVERPRPMIAPRVDVYETKEAFIVVADVPGVAESTLDITLEKDQLTVEGRVEPAATENRRLRLAESVPGGFLRTFALPDGVDRERISATVKSGVLTLVLPKSEALRPRKITVQPAS